MAPSQRSLNSMSNHLTEMQLERFCARALAAPELVSTAEHLSGCHLCQQQFNEVFRRRRDASSLSFTLADEVWLRHEHLAYEEIAPYVTNQLDELGREIIEGHLKTCWQCREDVRSFGGLRQQTAPAPGTPDTLRNRGAKFLHWLHTLTVWRRLAYALLIAAALLSTATLLMRLSGPRTSDDELSLRQQREPSRIEGAAPEPPPAVVPGGVAAAPSGAGNSNGSNENGGGGATEGSRRAANAGDARPAASHGAAGRARANPSVVMALDDGGGKVTLSSAGELGGLEDLPRAMRQTIRGVLVAQNIERPRVLAGIVGETSALRGEGEGAAAFRPLAPARAVINDDRPTFRWAPLAGASSYQVQVVDAQNREVASSGQLPATASEWTPGQALARGEVYTWAVIAAARGEQVISPAPSEPEMRFKVLSAAEARELSLLEKGSRSHLARGVFYARAGMVEEAEGEFRQLVNQNPQSAAAAGLLRAVRSWR